MSPHPSFEDLVERSDAPEVLAHLQACAACRAQARMLSGLDEVEGLPGLDEARAAMSRVRSEASSALSLSWSQGASGPEADDGLAAGRIVERYTVEALLGRGGMGAVYRVRHNQLGSLHALKVLSRAGRSERARMAREGRAQARLRHPHVVAVSDVVDLEGTPGLVMELVEGPSLAEHLRRSERLPPAEVDHLAQQVLRGVAAAHEAGVVHRDLKPANVLLVPGDEGVLAKVADFGLARDPDEEDPAGAAITRPGAPLGTPAYMAPEQLRDARQADARSDVWSLGALLYELATGRQAFAGRDLLETLDRVRAGEHRPVREAAPDLPAWQAEAIETALRVDPALRHADGRAFLQAWRGGTATVPEPAAPATTARTPVVLGLLLAGTLAAGALLALRGPGSPPPLPAVAEVAEVAGAAPEPASAVVSEERFTARPDTLQVYALALDPEGRRVAWTDGLGLWIDDGDGAGAHLLVEGGPLHNLDFFPDGERLLASGWMQGQEGTWSVDRRTGALSALNTRSGRFVALSPDGERLAIADATGLWVSGLDGRDRTRIRPLLEGVATSGLAWSPSGRALAAVHRSPTEKQSWLEITAADGSASRRVVLGARLDSLGISPLAWLAPDRLLYTEVGGTEDEPQVELYALDGAETAVDGQAARLLHTWTGHFVTRLRATADGRHFVTSRVHTELRAWLLPTGGGELRRLVQEDWPELPVGWTPQGEVLVRSMQPGRGLLARAPGTGEARVVATEPGRVGSVDPVGGGLAWLRLVEDSAGDGEAKASSGRLSVARLGPGDPEPVEVLDLGPIPLTKSGSHPSMDMRCAGERCFLSRLEDERLRIEAVDPADWTVGAPLLELEVAARTLAWAPARDGRRLAVASADPPTLRLVDLDGGPTRLLPLPLDLPESVAWSPDGRELYLSGLDEETEDPYRIFVLQPDGPEAAPRLLWSSMTRNPVALDANPDGSALAVGIFGFDDDLWRGEGALGAPPSSAR